METVIERYAAQLTDRQAHAFKTSLTISSTKDLAKALHVAPRSITYLISVILAKFNARSRHDLFMQLIAEARRIETAEEKRTALVVKALNGVAKELNAELPIGRGGKA